MKAVAAFVVTVALAGCATQGKNSFQYTEPKQAPIRNEIQVNAPQPQVWDTLVRDLAKSFYVINNIDRNPGS
jgi:hypothetical protein